MLCYSLLCQRLFSDLTNSTYLIQTWNYFVFNFHLYIFLNYLKIFSVEHLNILLFGLAQRLHKALSKVDISFYTSSDGDKLKNVDNNVPSCHHQQPAKLVMVKKEGPNKVFFLSSPPFVRLVYKSLGTCCCTKG